jgi:hypothetical protein
LYRGSAAVADEEEHMEQ